MICSMQDPGSMKVYFFIAAIPGAIFVIGKAGIVKIDFAVLDDPPSIRIFGNSVSRKINKSI